MRSCSLALVAFSILAGGCATRGFVPGRLDAAAGVDASSIEGGLDAQQPDSAADAGDARDALISCPGPLVTTTLFAVHPPVAEEGQTIWLEGSFGVSSPVDVEFPSGIVVRVCAPSAVRFPLTVPDGAGAGRLTTGSTSVQFRALPFRTELVRFHRDNKC